MSYELLNRTVSKLAINTEDDVVSSECDDSVNTISDKSKFTEVYEHTCVVQYGRNVRWILEKVVKLRLPRNRT